MKRRISGVWSALEGWHGLILFLYTVFIFSAYFVIITNRTEDLIKWVILVTVLSFWGCPALLRGLRRKAFSERVAVPEAGRKERLKWGCLFFFAPLVLFLIKYIAYYPGAFSTDSIDQLGQVYSGQYNDWHPVFQTLLTFWLPLRLTGGWQGSIVLFQLIALAGVIAYALMVLWQYAGNRFAVCSLFWILLNPGTSNLALYPWKDVTFGMGALLLTAWALRLVSLDGKWLDSLGKKILLAAGIAGTTLVRHNALLFTVPFFLTLIPWAGWKKMILPGLIAVLLVVGIRIPVYRAIGVEAPGSRQIETLGLPMTVIGAVARYAPEDLDEETRVFVNRIGSEDDWKRYQYGEYNPVKFYGANNQVIEEYGAAKVISMAWRCLLHSTREALRGLIRLTDPVYTVCDDYTYYVGLGLSANDYGLKQGGVAALRQINEKITRFLYRYFPFLFMYLGVPTYILLALALSGYRLRQKQDRKKVLLLLPMLVYNFGTALLMTGASDSSRFFHYTFWIAPLLAALLIKKNAGGEAAV